MTRTNPLTALAVLMACTLPIGASAATFTVDDLGDSSGPGDTAPGDGVCEDIRPGTRCTLRAAIEEANALEGRDTIEFSVAGSITPFAAPMPVITEALVIDGSTAPGYVEGGSLAASPPRVYLNGLLHPTANGLHFRGATASVSDVLAVGIVGFGTAIRANLGANSLWVQRCWIGLNADGSAGGNDVGLFLQSSFNEVGLLGGPATATGLGNVISSNSNDPLVIVGSSNRVRGNIIGLGPSGSGDRGNAGRGVVVIGNNNLIGGVPAAAANRITHNGSDGIRINGADNTVQGNDIGGAGLSTFGNSGHGIAVYGSGNLIGDESGGSLQHVRGHALSGVRLGEAGVVQANDNVVANNRISFNHGHGVLVDSGTANRITDNDVIGSDGDGINLRPGAVDTRVVNNLVGLLFSVGTGAPVTGGNFGAGIREAGSGNWIGVEHVDNVGVVRPNIIGFNGAEGVRVGGAGVIVRGNFVGATADSADIGNTASGIHVDATAPGVVLDGNVIGFNAADGVRIYADGALLCGNRIGVAGDDGDVGNAIHGVRLIADDAIVGGGPGCTANVIGFNGADGIAIAGNGSEVSGNLIGGHAAGSSNFGNGASGIRIGGTGSAINEIGENSIAANALDGIRLDGGAGGGNVLIFNEYRDNGGTGIDLGGDGLTANDPGDADTGPNMRQNTPELALANLAGDQLTVSYRVDSTAVESAYPLRIEFYLADGSGRRQGIRTLAFETYETPGALASADLMLPAGVLGGRLVAIAHDAMDNSSEFSAEIVFGVPDGLFVDGFESVP